MKKCCCLCRIAKYFDSSSTSFSESFILKGRTNKAWNKRERKKHTEFCVYKNNNRAQRACRVAFLGRIIQTDFFIGMTTWTTLFEEIYWGNVKCFCDTININDSGGYNAIWNNFRRNLIWKYLRRNLSRFVFFFLSRRSLFKRRIIRVPLDNIFVDCNVFIKRAHLQSSKHKNQFKYEKKQRENILNGFRLVMSRLWIIPD